MLQCCTVFRRGLFSYRISFRGALAYLSGIYYLPLLLIAVLTSTTDSFLAVPVTVWPSEPLVNSSVADVSPFWQRSNRDSIDEARL